MTGKLSRTSRVAQWTLITSLALLLFSGAAYFVSARSGRGLPYRDSFATGKTDEWHSYGGTWEVADAAIRNESNERGAKLITGSPNWKNYSIEGDIMISSITGYASDAGFVLRSSDEEQGVYAYYGYFALLHTVKNEGGSLLLGRVGQKPIVIKSFPLPSGLQTHIWYHMKLLAVGCRFFASVRLLPTDGTYTVELKDPPCLTHGRAGLLSSHAGGVWRNIVIQSATERDADSMHAMIPAQASATSSVSSLKNEVAPAAPAARVLYKEQVPSPAIPISDAHLKSLVSPIRATISGQVILTSPDLFVQDYSGGIPVHLSGNAQLKI
ncbi:MAG: hypothetical protein P4L87_16825, partial [Formivibrio sp.]|nr:hypothetical protein [Formivibrio sp.]